MHHSRIHWGSLNALILIAPQGEECVGAMTTGASRELGVAHHQAAGKGLVRSFLEAAAGIDPAFQSEVPMH